MASKKTSRKPSRKTSSRRAAAKTAVPAFAEDADLTPAEVRELERRISDLDARTRYLIVSVLDPNFVLYYNVSEDTYGWNDPSHATLFKRRQAAQTILKLLGDRDTLVECEVKKGGQLIKKSIHLPQRRTRPKPASNVKGGTKAQTVARKSKRKSETGRL